MISPSDRSFPTRPLLGASVAVWDGDRVLLARRAKEPAMGLWSVPGGLVELGETVADAALRELMEETGVTAAITGIVDVVDIIERAGDGRVAHHFALVFHTARYLSGTARAGDDADAVAWVALDDLDALALTAGTADLIRRSHAPANGGDTGGKCR